MNLNTFIPNDLKWKFRGEYIREDVDIPDTWYGFVYMYTYKDGMKFIGNNNFWKKTSRKSTKYLKKPDTHINFSRLGTIQYYMIPTSWKKFYKLSNKAIYRDISTKYNQLIVGKEILNVYDSKYLAHYYTLKELMRYEALERDDYFNVRFSKDKSFIDGKVYSRVEEEEMRKVFLC